MRKQNLKDSARMFFQYLNEYGLPRCTSNKKDYGNFCWKSIIDKGRIKSEDSYYKNRRYKLSKNMYCDLGNGKALCGVMSVILDFEEVSSGN